MTPYSDCACAPIRLFERCQSYKITCGFPAARLNYMLRQSAHGSLCSFCQTDTGMNTHRLGGLSRGKSRRLRVSWAGTKCLSKMEGWFGAWSLQFTGCTRSFQPGASGEVRAATSLNWSGEGGVGGGGGEGRWGGGGDGKKRTFLPATEDRGKPS